MSEPPMSRPVRPACHRLAARELAELARSVAREAADLLVARHAQVAVVQVKSSPTDVVTQLDRAAEQLIRDRLLAARPGDAILGEEGGETGNGSVRWIVDPLDGTVNYLYGLPDWAVSIAAEVDGEVVAGAVCVPLQRNMFTATLGGGAWLESEWQACSGSPAPPASRWPARSSRLASATRRRSEPSRARSRRPCYLRCGTSGGVDRLRRTCARLRPGASTLTTSRVFMNGTSRRAG